MSEKRTKYQRRQQRKEQNAFHEINQRDHPTRDLLATSLSAAVPPAILTLYEQGGPSPEQFEEARAFGRILASKGDRLLFRSSVSGETTDLFNRLARSLAVLAFVIGGVPEIFGQRFDAVHVLAGFFGKETAEQYCLHIRERYTQYLQEQEREQEQPPS